MIQLYSEQLEFKICRDYHYWNPDFHMHNFYEIFLLTAGEVDFYINNTKRHILPGTIIFITDHDIHKSRLVSGNLYERIYIHIPPFLLDSYSSGITSLSECFHSISSPFLKLSKKYQDIYCSTVRNMITLEKNKDFGYDIMIQAELLKLLVLVNTLCRNSPSDNFKEQYSERVYKIIYHIEEHLCEPLSLDKIADYFSIDKYHLCHIFKSETSTTIYHFIQLKRIALAKQLLADGYSLTETCYDAGFNNYNHFITTFKKHSGITPKQYIRQCEEKNS